MYKQRHSYELYLTHYHITYVLGLEHKGVARCDVKVGICVLGTYIKVKVKAGRYRMLDKLRHGLQTHHRVLGTWIVSVSHGNMDS